MEKTKRLAISVSLMLSLTLPSFDLVRADNASSVDLDVIDISSVSTSAQTAGFSESIPVARNLSLPARSYLVALQEGEKANSIIISHSDNEIYGPALSPSSLLPDIPTSENGRYDSLLTDIPDLKPSGRDILWVNGEIEIDGNRYAELLILSKFIDSTRIVRSVKSIALSIGSRTITSSDLLERSKLLPSAQSRFNSRSSTSSKAADYLIITNSALASSFSELVTLKTQTGFKTGIKLIEEITSLYTGRDDAEKLRNYLKDYYAEGGEYVLLGGDETVLPIRYAYPSNAYSQPDFEYLKICDLYFADLTGEWDSDSDGIWGEPYHDKPDIIPELLVGRLPFNSPEQVITYTKTLRKYLLNPGGNDRSYLGRTFFFSSDQMRDYGSSGQHGSIASVFPPSFTVDTVAGVEASSGYDTSPSNADPSQLSAQMQNGYGIVHIIAHGRSDGFVIKSSGYNQWPKSYLLTDSSDGSHGKFASIVAPEKPAFYYSLSCEIAAFDFDQPPVNSTNPSVVEQLLSIENGAVAFIANSRWGWVSSSYILHRAFFDSVFSHGNRPAIESMYEVQQQYYYQRDIVYGQLFLGDPSLVLYTSIPSKPAINVTFLPIGVKVMVSADGAAAQAYEVVITESDSVVSSGRTDGAGNYFSNFVFLPARDYKITATSPGELVSQALFAGSIVTSVDEDASSSLPTELTLYQNYPNPFNPSTTFEFALPQAEHVTLEIFNLLGQQVAQLSDRVFSAGQHSVEWDASSNPERALSSGVYFYRMTTPSAQTVRKMILLK